MRVVPIKVVSPALWARYASETRGFAFVIDAAGISGRPASISSAGNRPVRILSTRNPILRNQRLARSSRFSAKKAKLLRGNVKGTADASVTYVSLYDSRLYSNPATSVSLSETAISLRVLAVRFRLFVKESPNGDGKEYRSVEMLTLLT